MVQARLPSELSALALAPAMLLCLCCMAARALPTRFRVSLLLVVGCCVIGA